MATALRVLPSQADDLAAVCAIGAQTLDRVAAELSSAALTIKRSRLRELIGTVLADTQATILCRVVFGLSTFESRKASGIEEIIDSLTTTLNARYAGDDRFADWGRVSKSLLGILKNPSVNLSAKAVDISYDFERILTDFRIITSIRPVYNDARDDIVGSTVVQTLRLDFVDGSGHADTISIAIDLSDIQEMKEVCDAARRKADLAKERLGETWAGEVIAAGEEES